MPVMTPAEADLPEPRVELGDETFVHAAVLGELRRARSYLRNDPLHAADQCLGAVVLPSGAISTPVPPGLPESPAGAAGSSAFLAGSAVGAAFGS
jgi:hypothetical protein